MREDATNRDQAILALFSVFGGTVLGFTLAQFVKVRALCLADDVSCIREWSSALSGWAAGAAALIAAAWTVRVLTKQIRQGREQHIELMKFQALERIMLVKQVGTQASMAHGTIAQIFHEFHDESKERSAAKLSLYVHGAKLVLNELEESDFAAKRLQAQGSLPPARMRVENCLPEFVTTCEFYLAVGEGLQEDEQKAGILRAASTNLMLAYEDLKQLQEEMLDFRRRWAHLAA